MFYNQYFFGAYVGEPQGAKDFLRVTHEEVLVSNFRTTTKRTVAEMKRKITASKSLSKPNKISLFTDGIMAD